MGAIGRTEFRSHVCLSRPGTPVAPPLLRLIVHRSSLIIPHYTPGVVQMTLPATGVLEAPAQEFYRYALEVLRAADVPVLVGGAYAFGQYTGIVRHTKDFDLFIRRADVDTALAAFAATGYRAELVYDHWLAKVYSIGHFVDLIFN